MLARFELSVNGHTKIVSAKADTPLLYILRNGLGLKGPKFGCGLGQCGACAILRDGKAVRSCITTIADAEGSKIVTIEGLGSGPSNPHPLQEAFIAAQAAQCGYCMSGMIIEAAALLGRKPNPSRDEIKAAMDGHLCRCGSYLRIINAIEKAAQKGRLT
jgi:nicotinate dehydrogenase subunit A